MRKIIYFGLLIALGASGCEKFKMKDDQLSIVQHDYRGDQLKVNGFYYYKDANSVEPLYIRYFFYKNGVIRNENANNLTNFNFGDGSYKIDWGLFEIEGDTIRFEKWYPSSGGPLPAYIREGTIISDTSFHINKSYRMINGERKELREKDELYHFYEYSPKPDSTTHYLQ